MNKFELEGLKEFCTPMQLKKLEAWVKHGSKRQAAKILGCHPSTLDTAKKRVMNKAAKRGFAPEHDMFKKSAPTHIVKGTSTMYDENGELKLQWVKTDLNKEVHAELLQGWVEELCETIPKKPRIQAPTEHSDENTLPVIVMGDPHAGLLAWHEEAGDDYNLKKWADEHRAAMSRIVMSAPTADECIIINLGDYFHANDHTSRTPRGQNVLDVDDRFAKVFREGCNTFEFMIDIALKKFQRVTVYVTKGNHDPESSFALAEVLRAYYRNESRVSIRGGIAYREYHEFGNNLIGITHGDTAKPAQLPSIMAAEQAKAWGRVKTRRWFVGHFHHQDRKEYPGCVVEIFPTLARNDAWHTGAGYISEKGMTCVVFDKKHGEVGRHFVNISQLD